MSERPPIGLVFFANANRKFIALSSKEYEKNTTYLFIEQAAAFLMDHARAHFGSPDGTVEMRNDDGEEVRMNFWKLPPDPGGLRRLREQ